MKFSRALADVQMDAIKRDNDEGDMGILLKQ